MGGSLAVSRREAAGIEMGTMQKASNANRPWGDEESVRSVGDSQPGSTTPLVQGSSMDSERDATAISEPVSGCESIPPEGRGMRRK